MFEVVPRDMIRTVQRVVKFIFEQVKLCTEKAIGADEIFPLFLCVLIHSQLAEVENYIIFLNNFLSTEEKMGEAGYCLVTLEAAFQHLNTMNLSEFAQNLV